MKAILMIDIPEKHLNFINAEKGLKRVDIGFDYDENEGWSFASYKLLEFKQMPERKIPSGSDIYNDYVRGWNDCIDAITGETE